MNRTSFLSISNCAITKQSVVTVLLLFIILCVLSLENAFIVCSSFNWRSMKRDVDTEGYCVPHSQHKQGDNISGRYQRYTLDNWNKALISLMFIQSFIKNINQQDILTEWTIVVLIVVVLIKWDARLAEIVKIQRFVGQMLQVSL